MKCSGITGQRRGRRFSLRFTRLWALPVAAGLTAALIQIAPVTLAAPAEGTAIPMPTRVERFNPDEQVCQPQAIRTSFARQLQPWADQPPAVLNQLRRMQQEMTVSTLQRCVSKGLLQPSEARQLENELGLQNGSRGATAPGSPAGPPASGASPGPVAP